MKLTKARIDAFQYEGDGKSRDARWDDAVSGLAVRIYPSGRRAFVLSYRSAGAKRMLTLGGYGALTLDQARKKAQREKGRVLDGQDPLEQRQQARHAPTVRELARDYLDRHALPHKRASSVRDDVAMIENDILPALGAKKVAAVRRRDIETLHQSKSATPYRANRMLALMSKMLNLAVKWDWRTDNPATGVQKFHEEKRKRWLSTEELFRLSEALDGHPNVRAANAVRMLMLTGARKSEVLRAEWSEIDFVRGVWTKPSAHTKQKQSEHLPLSAPALLLLSRMREIDPTGQHLFPGDRGDRPLRDVKKFWPVICQAACLTGARLHDLRHSYASHLVSSGLSLEIVGRLLGHTQAATTQRYSHLADDPLRAATERFGALVSGASKRQSAEVVELGDRKA